jgi:hypothetical protein
MPARRSAAAPKRSSLKVGEPSKALRKKVGNGGFSITQSVAAERAVKSVAKLFIAQARDDLATLDRAFAAMMNGARGEEPMRSLFLPAFALKSMGGTCGYPLLSQIADSLCALIENLGADGFARGVQALEAHIDAIRAVLKDDIRGDGGALGRELLKGLQAIAAR